jgi:predicted 2-oxoglutarate/Fe(II)-dependent dioxygenase YbiX
VIDTLESVRERLSDYFRIPLASFEEPQFLRYKEGDYFVAHQDGNTPSIFDDSRHRRVSLIVFLSDPASYSGADLLFHTSFTERVTVPAPRGTAVAFRSELTHEVTPLVTGERYTIVTWYR